MLTGSGKQELTTLILQLRYVYARENKFHKGPRACLLGETPKSLIIWDVLRYLLQGKEQIAAPASPDSKTGRPRTWSEGSIYTSFPFQAIPKRARHVLGPEEQDCVRDTRLLSSCPATWTQKTQWHKKHLWPREIKYWAFGRPLYVITVQTVKTLKLNYATLGE